METSDIMLWTGRVLTTLFALFMLGASIFPKLTGMPVAEETLAALGWPAGYALMIGIIELVCVVLYLVPSTSLLGAVLMTGLLGGAVNMAVLYGSSTLAPMGKAFTMDGQQIEARTYLADDGQWHLQIGAVAAVPEPETYAMLLAGLGLIGAVARRRRAA